MPDPDQRSKEMFVKLPLRSRYIDRFHTNFDMIGPKSNGIS